MFIVGMMPDCVTLTAVRQSNLENSPLRPKLTRMKPFEELVKFIADAAGPEKLDAFKPSKTAEKRVAELLAKQEEGILSSKESEELQLFVQLDRVMSLAKAKARAGRRPSAA